MKTRIVVLVLLVLAHCATSGHAQLVDLSLDAGTSFRQDFVNTDLYFSLAEGSAHFDFRYDAARLLSYNPPRVQIDSYSELDVSGWSPMIDFVPPGHGGAFHFDELASNVTQRFAPLAEPSRNGFAALLLPTAGVYWRSRDRSAPASALAMRT